MKEIVSKLEGEEYELNELEYTLKPLGYDIGGGWEYDHGSFDYKLDDDEGYMYLRVPFKAIKGELERPGCIVEIQSPYLLHHVYQIGLDDNVTAGNTSATLNQFSEPQDADGSIDEKWVEAGEKLVRELEDQLLA
ncbi:YugN-like family protein [Pseudalkalibacillus decolorationis]|uniref:YugN-like family protein n=1 Tax=Pseudalkalibacillus decolorationis TaxID=163879 RepID=UPI0021497A31|nr:YugN-like family protein [Pseudalkalibacillus decolorationis]